MLAWAERFPVRTRAIEGVAGVLELDPGGISKEINASDVDRFLAEVSPAAPAEQLRFDLVGELLDDIRTTRARLGPLEPPSVDTETRSEPLPTHAPAAPPEPAVPIDPLTERAELMLRRLDALEHRPPPSRGLGR